MGYSYEAERPSLFTDEGQRQFLQIRDQVMYHLKESGAVRHDKATKGLTGSAWEHIACFDRMIELGELSCLSPDGVWAQHKIYTKGVVN